jgi:hypothetical protein
VLLRTPRTAPRYEQEWHSFVTALDAHASEKERDLCPPPVDQSEQMADELGDKMLERITKLRASRLEKLHVKGPRRELRAL